MQREKGKRGELEAVALLRRIFPDVRSKRAGGETLSVDRGRDLLDTPGYAFQVKLTARPQPLAALAEARGAAHHREVPVALVRESRPGIRDARMVAVMYADDFVRMVELQKALVPAKVGG